MYLQCEIYENRRKRFRKIKETNYVYPAREILIVKYFIVSKQAIKVKGMHAFQQVTFLFIAEEQNIPVSLINNFIQRSYIGA